MTDERADYLATGSEPAPDDRADLDLIRAILADGSTWSDPPPDVGDGVRAAISGEVHANKRHPHVGYIAAALIAALVIAVIGVAAGLTGADRQIVAMQGTDLEPEAVGQAALRPSASGWWIRLDVTGLPPAGAGQFYEGWMWNEAGEGVSVGTFHMRGGDETVVLWSGVDPADYPSIWVTLESEDGDPAASELVVMRGRIDA